MRFVFGSYVNSSRMSGASVVEFSISRLAVYSPVFTSTTLMARGMSVLAYSVVS